jgi:hypothetical protein
VCSSDLYIKDKHNIKAAATYNNSNSNNNNNNNNTIQFFTINVPSQQLQRQLQTQHSVHIIGNKIKSNNNSITNIHSIKAN